jgi:hypothetical protein
LAGELLRYDPVNSDLAVALWGHKVKAKAYEIDVFDGLAFLSYVDNGLLIQEVIDLNTHKRLAYSSIIAKDMNLVDERGKDISGSYFKSKRKRYGVTYAEPIPNGYNIHSGAFVLRPQVGKAIAVGFAIGMGGAIGGAIAGAMLSTGGDYDSNPFTIQNIPTKDNEAMELMTLHAGLNKISLKMNKQSFNREKGFTVSNTENALSKKLFDAAILQQWQNYDLEGLKFIDDRVYAIFMNTVEAGEYIPVKVLIFDK